MLKLIFTSEPFDRIPAQVAIASYFQDIRPLQGTSALVDWRLNGRISKLLHEGKLSGSYLETLMVPLRGRCKAGELLLFGLGPAADWNEARCEAWFKEVLKKTEGMKYEQIIVSFEDLAKDFMEWRYLLRELVHSLYPRAESRDLALVLRENPKWIAETRRRNMDLGVDVQIEYDL